MSRRQKCRLRELTPEERAQLEQISRAHAVPASHVARAKALLAVAAQQSNTAAVHQAARQAGWRSGDPAMRSGCGSPASTARAWRRSFPDRGPPGLLHRG